MKAKQIANFTSGSGASQRLYEMEPPYLGHRFIVASAASVFGNVETYLFPADQNGEITDFLELEGSRKGIWDHESVVRGIGYSIA